MEIAIVVSTLIASVAYAVPKVMIVRSQFSMAERQLEALIALPGAGEHSMVGEPSIYDRLTDSGETFSDSSDTLSGGYV